MKIRKRGLLFILICGIFSSINVPQGCFREIIQDRIDQTETNLWCITNLDASIYSDFEEVFRENFPSIDTTWLELSSITNWRKAVLAYSIDFFWGTNDSIFDILAEEKLLSPVQNSTLESFILDNIPEFANETRMLRKDENGSILWVDSSIDIEFATQDFVPEPIAIAYNTSNKMAVEDFIYFVLSPEGQKIWPTSFQTTIIETSIPTPMPTSDITPHITTTLPRDITPQEFPLVPLLFFGAIIILLAILQRKRF
ncbi:MAG: hypothetical protein ACW98F_04780 [Candidatus Hodarchaeales archaeon]|jgi:hypothetical protein